MTSVSQLEDSDPDVIERVLAGDAREFAVLVRRHNQRLFRAARAVTWTDADAEDALQQAWLEVFRNLGQFRGEAAFTTWATLAPRWPPSSPSSSAPTREMSILSTERAVIA